MGKNRSRPTVLPVLARPEKVHRTPVRNSFIGFLRFKQKRGFHTIYVCMQCLPAVYFALRRAAAGTLLFSGTKRMWLGPASLIFLKQALIYLFLGLIGVAGPTESIVAHLVGKPRSGVLNALSPPRTNTWHHPIPGAPNAVTATATTTPPPPPAAEQQ